MDYRNKFAYVKTRMTRPKIGHLHLLEQTNLFTMREQAMSEQF